MIELPPRGVRVGDIYQTKPWKGKRSEYPWQQEGWWARPPRQYLVVNIESDSSVWCWVDPPLSGPKFVDHRRTVVSSRYLLRFPRVWVNARVKQSPEADNPLAPASTYQSAAHRWAYETTIEERYKAFHGQDKD